MRNSLSPGHVAWWAWIPLWARLVFIANAYVPVPFWFVRRAIHASVTACALWFAAGKPA